MDRLKPKTQLKLPKSGLRIPDSGLRLPKSKYSLPKSGLKFPESDSAHLLRKAVTLGGIAVVTMAILDPQLFAATVQAGTGVIASLTHGIIPSTSANLDPWNLSLTCAQVDSQYHFVSIAQAGGYRFNGPQTASCAGIQQTLNAWHSPFASLEPQIYVAYAREGINNAAAMGIAQHEGGFGTQDGVQKAYENIGAMRWAPPSEYPNPNYTESWDRWMDFHKSDQWGNPTGWIAAAQDHAALIRSWINYNGWWHGVFHHAGDGGVNSIISILSPSSENNVPVYDANVENTMRNLYSASANYSNQHSGYPNGPTASLANSPVGGALFALTSLVSSKM